MKKQEKRRQVNKEKRRDKLIISIINKLSIALLIISFPFLLAVWIYASIEGAYPINYVALALGLFTLSFILRTIAMRG